MSFFQRYSRLIKITLFFLFLVINTGSCSKSITPVPIPSNDLEENGVITFAVSSFLIDDYEPLTKEFHKQHPSINIQLVELQDEFLVQNGEDLGQLASSADTMVLYGGRSQLLHNANYFLDLTSLIESDSTFHPDELWPGVLSGCQDSEGHNLGVPININEFYGIYFDSEAFDIAGISKPAPGWTWDNFQQDISALARRDGTIIRYGFADMPISWAPLLSPIIDAYLGNVNGNIDSPALLNEIRWYFDLVKKDELYPMLPEAEGNEDKQWLTLITQQSPAMWIGGLNQIALDRLVTEKYDIAPFPVDEEGGKTNTTPLWPTCAVVSAGSTHPLAAWEWLNFLTWQSFRGSRAIPARPSIADVENYWGNLPENSRSAVRFGLEHGWYGSPYPEILKSVNEALVKALIDGANIDSALTNVTIDDAPISRDRPIITVATPQPTEARSEDAIVINYMAPEIHPGDNTLKSLVEQFQREHPDIAINISYSFTWKPAGPDQDYLTLVTNKYDCFTGQLLQASEKYNLLYSLNPLLATEDVSLTNDFYPGQLEAYTINGELYGLPTSFQPMLLFYNADILDQRNVQPPTIDWTFDDFLKLITATTSGSGTDHIYGTSGTVRLIAEGLNPIWEELLTDPSSVLFNSSDAISSASYLANLVDDGIVYPNNDMEKIAWLIASGHVAFWSGFADELDFTNTDSKLPHLNTGFVSLPNLPSHKWFGESRALGQYISSKTKNPQACWAWIKFLSDQPNIFPGVPARQSVAESVEWESNMGTQKATVLRAAIEQSTPESLLSNQVLGPLYGFLEMALDSILTGSDPTRALTIAQRQADNYLECIDASNVSTTHGRELLDKVGACYQKAYQDVKEP